LRCGWILNKLGGASTMLKKNFGIVLGLH